MAETKIKVILKEADEAVYQAKTRKRTGYLLEDKGI